MEKKILKIFSLLLISLPFIFIPSDHSRGCGWGPEPDDYYTIFENTLFDLPLLKPFFLSENYYFPYDQTSSLGERTDNLREWLQYFNNIPTIDDIESVIYPTTPEDITRILEFVKSDKKIKGKLAQNTLVLYLYKNKKTEVPEYLLFAKQCEQYTVSKDPWEEIIRDSTAMSALIDKGERSYSGCSDTFLKERYAYQVIRLAHYSKQYEKAISLYEKYFQKENNLIQKWSLSHKAGCLRRVNRLAEANYIFSKLFDECVSRRIVSAASFLSLNDSLLEKTLQLCSSDHEKAVVYVIASYKSGIDPQTLENIYKLEPKSEYLELLLSREISKMEREILPVKYGGNFQEYLQPENQRYYYYKMDYYRDISSLISKIADNNNCLHPYLWHYAAAYMAALVEEGNSADNHFIAAKRLCPKEDLSIINRIKIVELISKIERIKKIDYNVENDLFKDLKWLTETSYLVPLHSKDAFIYIMYLLANKYLAQGDIVKAHMCIGTKDFPRSYSDIYSPFSYNIHDEYFNQPAEKIYEFLRDRDFNQNKSFDDFLAVNYILDEDNLLDIEGTKFLSQYKFKQAEEKFSDISNYFWGSGSSEKNYMYFDSPELPADPFEIHVNDCHDCDYKSPKKEIYNKLTFCKKMIELESLIRTDNKNADKYYFLLGNAYYNLTYYGNSWSAIAYTRDTWKIWDYKENRNPDEPKSLYDCSKAMEFYRKAMELTKDKELAARCVFMAAKCEQNKFYNQVYDRELLNRPEEFRKEKLKFRNYFRILVEKYQDTKFYEEAITECKYFNEFAVKH